MLRNYFTTAFRFLIKNRTFSLINITGLALGTLCCLYIVLYVTDQFSYDKHHDDGKDIYRVTSTITLSGEKHDWGTTSPPIAPAMKNDFSEIARFTRVAFPGMLGAKEHLLRYGQKSFYETEALLADSTFFDVFTYHFTSGTPRGALSAPYSVVLLKSTADKLFAPGVDPRGKTISIDDAFGKHDYMITGVVDESLGHSHIKANLFITMNSGGLGDFILGNTTWSGNNLLFSYIKLRQGASAATLEAALPAFLDKYGGKQLKENGMEKSLHLQPVAAIHTSTGYTPEVDKTVNPSFLYLLLLIAGLIQVIACINFMNLSTARASKRAKEVGVRKVIGAARPDLIRQFIGESLLVATIGVLVAVPLLMLALPYLNQITRASLGLNQLSNIRMWLLLGGMIVLTGVVSGSYPAFYLSAFKAIKVLKGNFSNHISAAGIRRSLVVFQFVLSITLISGIIVIYSQLNYIEHKDLGFDKDQKLVFTFHTNDTRTRIPSFIDDIKGLHDVLGVSWADNYPGTFVTHDRGVWLAGGTFATAEDAKFMISDEHFLQTTGIKLSAGRDFSTLDSGKVLINETLAHKLGLTPSTAPGTTMFMGSDVKTEIVGVIKDFNYNSLHDPVGSFMLFYSNGKPTLDLDNDMQNVIVSVSGQDYPGLIRHLETIWKHDVPATPFEYAFLDDVVQKQYETETTLSHIIDAFTLMAIFISCLGLFGLAAFSAEQRFKEIGIRKVLGAGVPGIVVLLSRDFLKLVGIALVIAVPISWWVMDKWLRAFTYRVDVRWWMFALAGLLAAVIAVVTVSSQALKAALSKPVNSLRAQ